MLYFNKEYIHGNKYKMETVNKLYFNNVIQIVIEIRKTKKTYCILIMICINGNKYQIEILNILYFNNEHI